MIEIPGVSELRRLGPFGIAYATLSLACGVAAILVVWPESGGKASWLGSLTGEIRFIMIAAIGGAIGCTLRGTAVIGSAGGEFRPGAGPAAMVVRLTLAIQLAVIFFLVIRSFVVLPTTPVERFSPFGVLVLGLLTGALAEGVISSLAKRILEPSNAELDSRLDRISNAVGATLLDNYHGRIRAQVLHCGTPEKEYAPASDTVGSSDEGWLQLEPNRKYTILAWFDPGLDTEGRGEVISISGGNDVSSITFAVTASSSAAVAFVPGRQTCTFDPAKISNRIAFEFVAPVVDAPFTIWLRVSQKDRLSTVLGIQAVTASRD